MKSSLTIIVSLFIALTATCHAQGVKHSKVGDRLVLKNALTLELITKHQNFNWNDRATIDGDISSPKSVKFRPDGKKYYVNSLEGGRTVVYDANTNKKIKVIKHIFNGNETELWAKPSGLYPFRKYLKNQNTFMGKPVESTFTHGGRYLWVPYYRRSYDINAQDPSAVAIIDTEKDTIVRMMETGPLPKMITMSPDGHTVAITHWGDNTIGLVDISSNNPQQWRHIDCVTIEHKLKMDFSTTHSINRDAVSGFKLRGTVFMPDSKHVLVACMCGTGIAVVDIARRKYMGMLYGSINNVRHLLIKNNYLYLSCNMPGKVQRIPIDSINKAIGNMERCKTVKGWETCNVFTGTRTISMSPSGRYLFAACSYSSQLAVVDTKSMKTIGQTVIDSYPVGLDISPDGHILITTSQGSGGTGGNAVNVFKVTYQDEEQERKGYKATLPTAESEDSLQQNSCNTNKTKNVKSDKDNSIKWWLAGIFAIVMILLLLHFAVNMYNMKKNNYEKE